MQLKILDVIVETSSRLLLASEFILSKLSIHNRAINSNTKYHKPNIIRKCFILYERHNWLAYLSSLIKNKLEIDISAELNDHSRTNNFSKKRKNVI